MILPHRFGGAFLCELAALSGGEHVPIAIKRYRDFSDFLYEKVKSKW